jgi:acyl dehydratase
MSELIRQRYYQDFVVGECFRSPSRTLTDAHFLFFAGLTGDNHPLHYDVEYAKHTPFGRPVAHGLLLAGLTALGASPLSLALEDAVLAFLEQSTRFLKPVFVGDTLTPEHEVLEVIPKGDRGLVRFRTTLRNQHGEICLEGQQLYLLRGRPPAESARAG